MEPRSLVTAPDSRTPSANPASLPRFAHFALWPLSLLGLAMAAYLLSRALAHRNLPAGCGRDSGCEEVLSSRWALVFGVPVSALAVAVYAVMLIALGAMRFAASDIQNRREWTALTLSSAVLVGSAAWFVSLQLTVIKAICPWCLAEHAMGVLIAAIVFASAPRIRKTTLLTGVCLVSGLALAQTFVPSHPAVGRLPAGRNADTGPGPDRLVSVLDGRLTLTPHELPILGSPDAPKLLVVLFDYCCPHCRATHSYLLSGLAMRTDELAVLCLPTPLNSRCNPFWPETEPRFEHACELARLALAVWRADRSAFPAFDAWLFESEKPRDPAEARRRAEELVAAGPLERALMDPWVDRQIEQNVAAYHNSGAERVPVILSPGMRAIVGRPESEAQLYQLLEKELSLRSSTESSHP